MADQRRKPPLPPLYDQAELDRVAAKRVLEALDEERQRIRAWVMHVLGRTPDGNTVLDWLEHDSWPKGSR